MWSYSLCTAVIDCRQPAETATPDRTVASQIVGRFVGPLSVPWHRGGVLRMIVSNVQFDEEMAIKVGYAAVQFEPLGGLSGRGRKSRL